MLDFNAVDNTQPVGRGIIPPESCVIVTVTVRPPKAGSEGDHALLYRSSKGNDCLDLELVVAQGKYKDSKFYKNFVVGGSEKAAAISMRELRTIVESARNIDPKDTSTQAAENRRLSDWSDFNGLQFICKVDAVLEESRKDGNTYVNNAYKQAITPNMEEYAAVAQHGELITDKPIPERPAATSAKPAASAPAWGAPAQASPTPAAPAEPAQKTTPAWAK